MNILVINGSPRRGSATGGLAKKAATLLEDRGAKVVYFDVGDDRLPLFTGEETGDPRVRKLKTLAEQADGFFICTPEYHNGISGALKNALDFLNGTHFRGKPAAIAAASGGGKGGINALNNLRLVLRGLYALVLPDQLVADPGCFDKRGHLAGERTIARLKDLTEQLMDITGRLSVEKKALGK